MKRFEIPSDITGGRFPLGKIAIEPFAPFAKVTSNVVLQSIIDFSPLGLTKAATELALVQLLKKETTFAQQRALSKMGGNGLTGTMLMWLGYHLAAKNTLTGDTANSLEVTPLRTPNPAVNAKAEFEGRTPGSIMLAGKWRQITGMGPFLDQLVLGATVYQADLGKLLWNQVQRDLKNGELSEELIDNALKTIAEGAMLGIYDLPVGILSDLPLAQGPTELVKFGERLSRARTSQDRYKIFAALGGKLLAGRIIPSGVSAVAQQTDPVDRRSRPNRRDSVLDAFVNPFRARVPGLRGTLERDLDVGGRSVPLGGFQVPGTEPELPGADPFRSTTPRGRIPLSSDIDRFELGISRLVQGPDEPNINFAGRQQQRMAQMVINLNEVRFSPGYRKLPDGIKKALIQKAMSRSSRQISR